MAHADDVGTLRLRVILPAQVLVDEPACKVVAEAGNGFFCLLPRHVDFVAALVPGILYYETAAGAERFAAIDEGTLVKCGRDVLVSVLDATAGNSLETLDGSFARSFEERDSEERRARSALARLEAATIRRFLELEKRTHGA